MGVARHNNPLSVTPVSWPAGSSQLTNYLVRVFSSCVFSSCVFSSLLFFNYLRYYFLSLLFFNYRSWPSERQLPITIFNGNWLESCLFFFCQRQGLHDAGTLVITVTTRAFLLLVLLSLLVVVESVTWSLPPGLFSRPQSSLFSGLANAYTNSSFPL